MTAPNLSGVWSYRALMNEPDLEQPFNELRFASARLELAARNGEISGKLTGEGWGTWIAWSLTLTGSIEDDGFRLRGENVIEDEHWVYDYAGRFAPAWPHALKPRDVLVGSVIRTAARERRDSAVGVHATFFAVRR